MNSSTPPVTDQTCVWRSALPHLSHGHFRRHVIRATHDNAPIRILGEQDETDEVYSITIQPDLNVNSSLSEPTRNTLQPSLRSLTDDATTRFRNPSLALHITVSGYLAVLLTARNMRLAILNAKDEGVIKFQHILPEVGSNDRPALCAFIDPISGIVGCTGSEGDLFFYQYR